MGFKSTVMAVTGHGLDGDRHANPRSPRQVLLMEQEALDALDLTPGAVRENVTISGLPIHQLAPGQIVDIGDEVRLEVTAPCEPCERMDEIRMGLRQAIAGRRGILARVLQGGALSVGDRVRVQQSVPAGP
jgi:MOSC domain-containing protein YiiM